MVNRRLVGAAVLLAIVVAGFLVAQRSNHLSAPGSTTPAPSSSMASYKPEPNVGFTAAADGTLWFAPGFGEHVVGEVGPTGILRTIPVTGTAHGIYGLLDVSDHGVWAEDIHSPAVLRIASGGQATAYPVPHANAHICDTTSSSTGLWILERMDSCERLIVSASTAPNWLLHIAPDGRRNEYRLPEGRYVCGQVQGPDGALWFLAIRSLCYPRVYEKHSEPSWVGRITPDGQVTYHQLPSGSTPQAIVSGANGTLWLTDEQGEAFWRVTLPYRLAAFHFSSAFLGYSPVKAPTRGSDGNLWFVVDSWLDSDIGRITPAGDIRVYRIRDYQDAGPSLTAGRCADLWLWDTASGIQHISQSGSERLDLKPSAYTGSSTGTLLSAVTIGPDGSVWYGFDDNAQLSRITPHGTVTHPIALPEGGHPDAMAFDAAGNLWVDDNGRGAAVRVTLPGRVSAFDIPTGGIGLGAVATASDGAIWTLNSAGNALLRRSSSGTLRAFVIPTAGSEPSQLAPGPGGSIWFTEYASGRIGRATASGHIAEYALPDSTSGPTGIVMGADGTAWFAESRANRIGRITAGGRIIEFATGMAGGQPAGITAGADGNLWFTDNLRGRIGRMTRNGQVTVFNLPAANSNPYHIVAGPDGALWFTQFGSNQIGRITRSGTVSEFDLPTVNSYPDDITAGPDGALWFTERGGNAVGRIMITGTIDEYPLANVARPEGIAAGNGGVWLTEDGGNWLTRIAVSGNAGASPSSGAPGGPSTRTLGQSGTALPAGCNS